MPRHREQTVETFLEAAGGDLVEQYFLRLFNREQLPPYLIGMTPHYALHLLGQIDEPLRTAIWDDLYRVRDVAHRDMGLPFIAAHRFDVPVRQGEKPERVAMRLFVEHRHAFNLAWALYSFRASSASISQHWLQTSDVRLDEVVIGSFANEVRSFFANQGRGLECRVSFYEMGDEVVVLVLHGSHLRTVPCWQGAEIVPNCFRPACEDVLIYNKKRALLSVKVSARGDWEHYVHSFANFILGDATLADDPARDRIYTLKPLQTRWSDWVGNGRVSAVQLRRAKFKPHAASSEVRTVEGEGLSLSEIDRSQGELIEVKLRFIIATDSREDKVTFTITPPCLTDLVKKRHGEVIAAYLREKGMQLR